MAADYDLSIGEMKTIAEGNEGVEGACLLADGAIVGEYKILSILGKGGMGEVYLAENIQMHKRYALKVLPPQLSKDSRFIDRFRVEARVMADFSHPNIVHVNTVGEEKTLGFYYLVMDYIEGCNGQPETLEAKLRKGAKLLAEEVQKLASQLCDALEYAHSFRGEGIIHRDLKPSNILLDATGNAHIADFGLAKVVGSEYLRGVIDKSMRLTMAGAVQPDVSIGDMKTEASGSSKGISSKATGSTGSLIGTYEYMSPEQQEGREASVQSDIYSLGLILYRALTGRKAKGRWKKPSELGASGKWDAIIEKCLAQEPEDRFASVAEIKAVLCGNGASLSKAKLPTPAFSVPKLIAALLLLLALLAGCAIFAWTRHNSQQKALAENARQEQQAPNSQAKMQTASSDKKYSGAADSTPQPQTLNSGGAEAKPLQDKTSELASLSMAASVKSKAESKYAQAQKLNARPGVSAPLEDAKLALETAKTLFDKESYGDALAKYQESISCSEKAIKIDADSKLAMESRQLCNDAKGKAEAAKASELANSLWNKAEELAVQAERLFKSGDFEKAAALWNKAASSFAEAEPLARKQGLEQSIADFNCGQEYARQGNNEEAAKRYRKAAEQGNADAQNKLGDCYLRGVGMAQDRAEAVKWYSKAAEQDIADAQIALGDCYEKGNGVAQNSAEAIKWCRRAAEQGVANAQNKLGAFYEEGKGIAQDSSEAAKWYRRAAEQGVATAQKKLGDCCFLGKGVPQSYSEAVEWHRKAAEQGFAAAQVALGSCYFDGKGVAQDYSEALKCYRKAAEQGFAAAQVALGSCYSDGKGVAQDYSEALKCYRKAAEQGFAAAQHKLGSCYYNGRGVTQDYSEAARCYLKAAEQGFAAAQNNLGVCYAGGKGVTQDYSEALKWYRKAAEQGFAAAQNNLGVCYAEGKEVAQDYNESAKWYRKAAEQGFAAAQNNLGACYAEGKGVARNRSEAVKWYRKAAEQGFENAKKELQKMGQ